MVDQFLFWRILRTHVGVTTVLTAVLWLVQVLDLFDALLGTHVSFAEMAYLSLLTLPRMIGFTLAPALLIAMLILLVRLLQDHEYFALTAAGLSPLRILRPVVILAILVTVLQAAVTFYLSPIASKQLRIKTTELKSATVVGAFQAGAFREILPNMTAYAQTQAANGVWQQVLIQDSTKLGEQTTYSAHRARVERAGTTTVMILYDGHITTKSAQSSDRRIDFTEYRLPLDDALTRRQDKPVEAFFNRNHMMIHQLLDPPAYGVTEDSRIVRMKARGLEVIANLASPLVFMLISFAAISAGGLSRKGYGRRILAAVIGALIFQIGVVYVTGLAARSNGAALVVVWPLAVLSVMSFVVILQNDASLRNRLLRRPS